MSQPTPQDAQALRAAISERRARVNDVLRRYGATNPRLFGSVARGDATVASDVDLLVDLDDRSGNPLMRLAGISEELTLLLCVQVDVATDALLRDGVSSTARRDLVPL